MNQGQRILVFELLQENGLSGVGQAANAFGIDVLWVEQVIETGTLSPVPLAPPVVRGIASHHGRIVTAFDPAPLLGLTPQPGLPGHALILEGSSRASLGMLVMRVRHILSRGALEEVGVEAGPLVAWVAKYDDRLIHVVDYSQLVDGLDHQFDIAQLEQGAG